MPDRHDIEAVQSRVAEIVLARLGSVEEELVATGLLDSVKAISLALALEEEFGLPLEEVSLDDMVTLSSLTRKVFSTMARSNAGQ
jgi:acyl carrier protein